MRFKSVVSFLTVLIIFNCSKAFSQKKHSTGQILDSASVLKMSLKSTQKSILVLPTKVNLKPYCPKIASQNWGTCYSYSSVYAARTILYNVTINDSINPSQNIFSTGFIQKLIFSNDRRCRHKGADTHTACELMENVGVVFKNDYPYDCSSQPITQQLMDKAKNYQIKATRLYEFCSPNELKIEKIKESLTQKNPVVIGINSVRSFHNNNGNPDLWKPDPNEDIRVNCPNANHAICVIGFDDSKYGGAFEIMNSWGTDWKGDGFIWVKYDDLANFASFGIELANKGNL